jgi:hypothetical protein
MRRFLNSGALITAVGVWGGLTTVAAGLHFIHPVKIHFPPIPPNS